MAKKPDWIKIRTEYETIGTSYRKLAEKYKVSFNTLKDRAKREEWVKGKTTTQQRITTHTTQKVVVNIANRKAAELTAELQAAELISQVVLNALKDPKQFNRHLIQRKEKSGGDGAYDERQWVEEETFEVVDARRLKDLAGALQVSTAIQRLIKGMLTEAEKQHLELEREKLALDKAKANVGLDDDDETGVVILPEVDYSLERGEQDADTSEEDNS